MVNSIILFILTHMLSRRRFQWSHSNHIRGYTNIDLSKSLGKNNSHVGGRSGRCTRRASRNARARRRWRSTRARCAAVSPAPCAAVSPVASPALCAAVSSAASPAPAVAIVLLTTTL